MQLIRFDDGHAVVCDGLPAALDDALLWCDCTYDEARAWVEPIARLTGVRPLEDHLLDAENLAHPSSFESTSDYELLIFRGLVSTASDIETAERLEFETRPTVFFVLPQLLVTVRAPDSSTVPRIKRRLIETAGGSHRITIARPDDLMLRIIDMMVDRYLELRNPLTDRLERWQRDLLAPHRRVRDWYELLQARNALRRIEGICEDQLEALQRWRDERLEQAEPGGPLELPESLQVRTNDLLEHVRRVLYHVLRLGSSIETAVQLHFSATAHRQNEIMRTLTLITAVFLPLTLITGIFGMNFEFIPGLHSEFGFWSVMGLMTVIALAMWSFFRARRWVASRPGRARPQRSARRAAADAAREAAQSGVDSADTQRR
ncbi:MAG: magnesium transporter CorA family protein [Burkholderiales bacterium]|nr:MAG: magnesium transporter CorA family protein [Burkholderiales bacterium]